LTGAANFLGGLPVLKFSNVKIVEFLHSQHSDKLTSLQLPRHGAALLFSFFLRADDGSRYRFKCVLISTLEEYVCRDDPTPGLGWCFM